MSQAELKPCPFCGGEAVLVKRYPTDGQTHYEVAVVECSMCRCRTDDYILNGYYGSTDTVRDAINAWNKRCDSPEQPIEHFKPCNCYHENDCGDNRCWGTREMDICTCGGDQRKCDFYPEKRITFFKT